MKTKKSIALLLCLLLTLTLCVPSSAAFAAEGDSSSDNGMVVSKTATANGDGTYTITLEAYATGSKIISEVTKDIPTDIVLVLDQSGSMDSSMPTETFAEYTNKTNSNYYANKDNLWYFHPDGSYVAVTVTMTNAEETYEPYTGQLNSTYYDDRWTPYLEPSDVVFYKMSEDITNATYVYTYTVNGQTYTITTSKNSETICDETFYRRSVNNNSTRRDALSAAVTNFVRSVSVKAAGADGNIATTEDNIDHRIAIVGFASTGTQYKNTELLSTSNVVNYQNAQSTDYKNALVSVNDNGQLNSRLTTAINLLDASGDTYLQYGMDMANKIFAQYPISEEDTSGRQRVVVVFTDGYPAPAGTNTFNYKMADDAISNALTTKNTYEATVYTVGVISGADPSANIETGFTYGGTKSKQQKVASNRYMHYVSSNYPSASSMQSGGSLNPDANPFNGGDSYYLSASDASTLNNIFQQIANKIESGGSSTTLTSEAVVKDFIAPQFTLPEGATTNDITLKTYRYTGENEWTENSNNAMGAAATISEDRKTVSVTGFNFSENWCGTETAANGTTTYRGNKLVISFTVSPKAGFLGGNNVFTNTSAGIYESSSATDPVKEFNRPQVNVPIGDITVTPANKNVYLLGSLTADQLKSDATAKVGTVSLNLTAENYGLESWQYEYVDISVNVTDSLANYVTTLSNLTGDQIYNVSVVVSPKGTGVGAAGTPADAKSGAQNANINVFKPVLTFQDSAEDYLTSWAFPGYYEQAGQGQNHVSDVWMHGTVTADVTKMGEAPTLALEYTADAADITGLTDGAGKGTIAADHDIPVNVEVRIGSTDVTNHVTFNHQCTLTDLESECGWSYETPHTGNATISQTDQTSVPEFLIHVKNVVADLTITKTGLNTNVYSSGDDESAIVTVACKDPQKDSRTWTIALTREDNWTATLKGLKVGATYTVTEQSGWTWRYTSTTTTSEVVIAKGGSSVIIANNQNNPYWLGGDNYCVNEFGIVGQGTSGD